MPIFNVALPVFWMVSFCEADVLTETLANERPELGEIAMLALEVKVTVNVMFQVLVPGGVWSTPMV
jgi:hypothetical protein